MDKHQTISLGYELIRPIGTKGTKMLKETTKTKTPAERMVENINRVFYKYREPEITINDYQDALYGDNMPLRNKLVRLGFIKDTVIPNPAKSDSMSTNFSRFLEEMNGIKDVDKDTVIPNPAKSDSMSTNFSRFLEEMNGIKDVDKKTKIDYRSYLGM